MEVTVDPKTSDDSQTVSRLGVLEPGTSENTREPIIQAWLDLASRREDTAACWTECTDYFPIVLAT